MNKSNFHELLKKKEKKKKEAMEVLRKLIENTDFHKKIEEDLRDILFLNNREVLPILYPLINDLKTFYSLLISEISNSLVTKRSYDLLEPFLRDYKSQIEENIKEYSHINNIEASLKLSYEVQYAIVNYLLKKLEILKEKEGDKNGNEQN